METIQKRETVFYQKGKEITIKKNFKQIKKYLLVAYWVRRFIGFLDH